MNRKTVFFIALTYLLVILLLALVFFTKRSLLYFVPAAFGPIPLGVPWFGALGAVLISLTGVFEHEHDWDSSYWPWHVARPLIGIGLAVVSVIILQAGVLSVGLTPASSAPATSAPASSAPATSAPATSAPATSTPATSTPATPIPSNLLFYLIAFLVGYREETFRELIKRLVDVILSPGDTGDATPTIHLIDPTEANRNSPIQVVITGSGLMNAQSVKFGDAVAKFTVNSDGQITATTPIMQAPGVIPLTVTTKRGSATLQFKFI